MMRPCSYSEAWGSIITSHKRTPKSSTRRYRDFVSSNTTNRNYHRGNNDHDGDHNGDHNEDHNEDHNKDHNEDKMSKNNECERCLLHIMSCPSCQAKLRQLSKLYIGNSDAESLVSRDSHVQYPSPVCHSNIVKEHDATIDPLNGCNFQNLQSATPYNINNTDYANNLYVYILVGLMLGYILSQIMTRK